MMLTFHLNQSGSSDGSRLNLSVKRNQNRENSKLLSRRIMSESSCSGEWSYHDVNISPESILELEFGCSVLCGRHSLEFVHYFGNVFPKWTFNYR